MGESKISIIFTSYQYPNDKQTGIMHKGLFTIISNMNIWFVGAKHEKKKAEV